MTWEAADIMMGLYIAVAVMLLIVLYHILFIVVDVRKIVRRAQGITEQAEAIVSKPLNMADQGLEWLMGLIEEKTGKK